MKPPGKPRVHPVVKKKEETPIWVVMSSASSMVIGPPKSPLQMFTSVPSMQSVRSDDEFGKRMRQAACEMTRPTAVCRFLIGEASPPPVDPHPEMRASRFSKSESTCRRFGKRTARTVAVNVIGRTNRTKAISLSLVSGCDKNIFLNKNLITLGVIRTHVIERMQNFLSCVDELLNQVSVNVTDLDDGVGVSGIFSKF